MGTAMNSDVEDRPAGLLTAGPTTTALALKLLEEAQEHRHTFALVALLESHRTTQRALAHDLAEERSLREQAEASEREIRQALVFKEIAIQEAHHRVKNTLQIAASVLSLQARATVSAEVRVALQEGYGRLHLLAKVHELLYTSADTKEVPMQALLQAVGDALQRSFAEMSARVTLRVACDKVALTPDDAIPMALLANEAATNAYKHAFPGDSAGEITVNLRCAPGNELILQVTDNGVGTSTIANTNGLGLKLIHSFAAQLRGTLVLDKPVETTGTGLTLTIHPGAKRRHELAQVQLIRTQSGWAVNDRTPA